MPLRNDGNNNYNNDVLFYFILLQLIQLLSLELNMNSDDEMYSAENSDSHEEEDEDGDDVDIDDEYVMTLDHESACATMQNVAGEDEELEEDFRYVVLSADQIVQHMSQCIREVNTVVQVVSQVLFGKVCIMYFYLLKNYIVINTFLVVIVGCKYWFLS